MFEEYLKEILAAYEKKKAEGSLPPNLSQLTPGSFRRECIIVYRERYLSTDDEILRSFFGAADKEKGYGKIIDNSKADEFRQMPKILKGELSNPGLKYIELLAWLIDFKPRPNTLFYKQANSNKATDQSGTNKTRNRPIPVLAMLCIVLFLAAGITFYFWKKNPDIAQNPLYASRKCMYWTGDHYEPVDCNEKIGDAPIVSLDPKKLRHFKKISSPDTLTKDAIGKIWYTKIAGEHQFFTDSGVHPVDTQRKLKPLSRYILSNHVSYYRYLLGLVLWSVCVIASVLLCIAFVLSFRKRRKKKMLQAH